MLTLRNPYIFAPVKTGYADGDGKVTTRHLAYYRKRSRHVGAVIPEPFYLAANLPPNMSATTLHESGSE